jgi:hypothetical protein
VKDYVNMMPLADHVIVVRNYYVLEGGYDLAFVEFNPQRVSSEWTVYQYMVTGELTREVRLDDSSLAHPADPWVPGIIGVSDSTVLLNTSSALYLYSTTNGTYAEYPTAKPIVDDWHRNVGGFVSDSEFFMVTDPSTSYDSTTVFFYNLFEARQRIGFHIKGDYHVPHTSACRGSPVVSLRGLDTLTMMDIATGELWQYRVDSLSVAQSLLQQRVVLLLGQSLLLLGTCAPESLAIDAQLQLGQPQVWWISADCAGERVALQRGNYISCLDVATGEEVVLCSDDALG